MGVAKKKKAKATRPKKKLTVAQRIAKAAKPQEPAERQRIIESLAMPEGRPTLYSPELGAEIVSRISRDITPMHVMCDERDHWPHTLTIKVWQRDVPEFYTMLMAAYSARADLVIADAEKKTADLNIKNRHGTHINQQRRMLNGLAQATAQRLSRDWALKTQHELAGPGGEAPVAVDYTQMSVDDLRELRRLQRKGLGHGSS